MCHFPKQVMISHVLTKPQPAALVRSLCIQAESQEAEYVSVGVIWIF